MYGDTALHKAVITSTNSVEIFQFLLENVGSSNLNVKNNKNMTCLHNAAIYPNRNTIATDIVSKLIDRGAQKTKKACGIFYREGSQDFQGCSKIVENGKEKEYCCFTPEQMAEARGHAATAQFIRYLQVQGEPIFHSFSRNYETDKATKPLGKLPDLFGNASESAGAIQNYVNFVQQQTSFSSLVDEQLKKLGEKFKWAENMGELDIHLDQAKEHAIIWNVDVSRGRFLHVDSVG